MKITKIRRIVLAIAALGIVTSYTWACYIAGYCTCAVSGSCYSKAVVPDCQIPTCIIADASATAWNVCTGNGTYQGREAISDANFCCPAACRIYDNCTHQYLSFVGGVCCFNIQSYQGINPGCN